jgi:hypothetical protein
MPERLHPAFSYFEQHAKNQWDTELTLCADDEAEIEFAPRFAHLPDALIPPGYRVEKTLNLCNEFALDVSWLLVGPCDAVYVTLSSGDYCDDDYDATLSLQVTSEGQGRTRMRNHAMNLARPILHALLGVEPTMRLLTLEAAAGNMTDQNAEARFTSLCAQRTALQAQIKAAARFQLQALAPWPIQRIRYSVTAEYDDAGDYYRCWNLHSIDVSVGGQAVRIDQCCGDYECDEAAVKTLFEARTSLEDGLKKLQACMPDECWFTELLAELEAPYGDHELTFEGLVTEAAA